MVLPLASFESMHQVLSGLRTDMMPLCERLTGVASGLAGIGALLYIAYRVWQAIARADELDLFPLLRPFAIGLCIVLFQPLVIGSLDGLLRPVSAATRSLMAEQVLDMQEHQRLKDRAQAESQARSSYEYILKADPEMDQELESIVQWDDEQLSYIADMYEQQNKWTLEGIFRSILRWLLEFLFEVASLVLDAVRTFYLIVLAILGPVAFAVSVYDGFQHSIVQWLQKYIAIYLWLPIADLFSAILARIQVLSLQRDMELLATNPNYWFDMDNTVYLVFLAIGIVGYFVIPSIASWVVQAGGFGSYNRKLSQLAGSSINYGAGYLGSVMGNAAGHAAGHGGGQGGQAGASAGTSGGGQGVKSTKMT